MDGWLRMSVGYRFIISILLLPLQIYGTILNYLPYKIPIWSASKIKDPHFKSSIQFGISLFLLPVYYILLIILFCMFFDSNLIWLIFGITLPVTGLFALYNYKHMEKLWGKLRTFSLKITKHEQYNALQKDRNQIINLIKSTINS